MKCPNCGQELAHDRRNRYQCSNPECGVIEVRKRGRRGTKKYSEVKYTSLTKGGGMFEAEHMAEA